MGTDEYTQPVHHLLKFFSSHTGNLKIPTLHPHLLILTRSLPPLIHPYYTSRWSTQSYLSTLPSSRNSPSTLEIPNSIPNRKKISSITLESFEMPSSLSQPPVPHAEKQVTVSQLNTFSLPSMETSILTTC